MTFKPQSGLSDLLLKRRSVVAQNITDPGPDDEALETLLTIAARVPDHGKLAPWRFVIFKAQARAQFGDHLAEAFVNANPDAKPAQIDFERTRFMRAPVVVAVISCAREHVKIPQWEQILSAGAVCQNLLVGAAAMGFAAQWLSEWCAYDDQVKEALGADKQDRIAGFIYLGTAKEPPKERPRPELGDIVSEWQGN